MVGEAEPEIDGRRIAAEARDRVRFEEEALALAEQHARAAIEELADPSEFLL